MNQKKLLTIIGITAGVIFAGILLINNIFKNNSDDADITSSSSFFLENKNNLYALFNEKGKQLTDFIFKDVEEFFNNVAAVENENDQNAIINSSGKYIADFGKYDRIYQTGALFDVRDTNGDYYILNSNGNIILNGNYDIDTYTGSYNSQMYAYIVSNDDEINIIDYNGNVLDTYNKTSDKDRLNSLNADKNIVLVVYNNKAYLYNIKTEKKLFEIEKDEGSLENFNPSFAFSEEYNVLVVNPFNDKYYVYRDNKLKYTISKEECNGIDYFKFYKDGLAYMDKTHDYVIMDYNGNKIASDVVELNGIHDYIRFEQPKNAIFYKDNNQSNQLNIYSSQISTIGGARHFDHIIIRNSANSYDYYNVNGQKLNEKPYYSITFFSNQGYAIASTDKNTIFIIDKNNKQVSDTYNSVKSFTPNSYMSYQDNLWIAKKDDIQYLLSNDGKVITDNFNEIDDEYGVNDKVIIKYTDSTKVYSIKENKIVLDINVKSSKLKLSENYACVTEDNGTKSYYSYVTGSKFYTE